MLHVHLRDGKTVTEHDLDGAPISADAIWIDLTGWHDREVKYVERSFGLHVPTHDELVEIESSSRVHMEDDAIYLATPIVFRDPEGALLTTPLGLVLTKDRLITTRYEDLNAFKDAAAKAKKSGSLCTSSAAITTTLLSAIVDRMADAIERIGAELDSVASKVFSQEAMKVSVHRPAQQDRMLRKSLAQIGRSGEMAARLRDSLLSLGRVVPYVLEMTQEWLPHELRPQLNSLRQDILSLNDYDSYLAGRISFLLDATLGLINIEQNSIIKVLTIVSVVGVPPTLVASMYGMNFKHMPELDWAYGYPYGLTLILFSAVAPLLWFKIRGWL